MSNSFLVERLRGKYPVGPTNREGVPEFGWRHFEPAGGTPAIQLEAATRIEELAEALEKLNGPRL